MRTKAARAKLSTTVAAENFDFLNSLVAAGKVATIAEAVDKVVQDFRRADNRRRLAQATAHYFDQLSPTALAEENQISTALSEAASTIDFDKEG